VAGLCNGSTPGNQTALYAQADVTLDYNSTVYVADGNNRLVAFDTNNYIGRVLRNFSSWPTFLYFDNRTSYLYITVMLNHLVYIWPTNKTIPNSGISYGNCSLNTLYYPSGIVVDSAGNAYISSYFCCWITKWAPNATSGTLIVGYLSGSCGSDNQSLNAPYNMVLDEPNSFLYVVDRLNNRVQRFVLGGSGIGVTVAGGNGLGSAANQLSHPTDIYLSRLNNSIYIADCFNNRIQKWQINGTYGVTVAGSPTGAAGMTPYLMDSTYALAVDYGENYLYASDSNNNRVQRFSLH
jgi:sugar lactone lactonase YvrE